LKNNKKEVLRIMSNREKTKLSDMTALNANPEVKESFIKEFKRMYKDSIEKPNIAVCFGFIKDMNNMVAAKCLKCGKIHIMHDSNIHNIHNISCCGNEKEDLYVIQYGRGVAATFPINGKLDFINVAYNYFNYHGPSYKTGDVFVLKFKNIYVIAKVGLSIISSDENREVQFVEGEPNDWLADNLSYEYKVRDILYFTEDLGFRCMSKNGNPCSLQTTINNSLSYGRYDGKLVENEYSEELINIMKRKVPNMVSFGKDAENYNKILEENKPTQKKEKKEVDTSSLLGELPEDKIITKCLEESYGINAVSIITEQNGMNVKYAVGCFCKNIIYGATTLANNYSNSIQVTCPCCGKNIKTILSVPSLSVHANTFSSTKIYSVYWQKFDEGVAARIFNFKVSIEPDLIKIHTGELTETKRILFYPNKFTVYNYSDGKGWYKGSVNDLPYSYSLKNFCCSNTDEELSEIINSSFLRFTGVEQAWGLGQFKDYAIEKKGIYLRDKFLCQWYKKPYLEYTIKSKLKSLTHQLIRDSIIRDNKGKNVYEFLGLTKGLLKIARERDMSQGDINALKSINDLQGCLSIDDWDAIKSALPGVDVGNFSEICTATDTKPKRMIEYLNSCYDNQCIQKGEALTIFNDYYRMARDIGFNLSDKNIKFPSSLKKEHDKAIFAYKVVENDVKKKHFIENSKKNEIYAFENSEYAVVIPKTPDEVVREGQLQHHCVASYVSRIESGETCICFIRKKVYPDVPFFTCEILNGTLYQVKGFGNKYPSIADGNLISFIEEWAKSKGLREEYMRH